MSDLDIDEVQELINLTPEQLRAWRSLERAVSKCKKVNIYFYQVLDKLNGLNGNNVLRIMSLEETEYNYKCSRDLNSSLDYPSIETADSWADDTHIVILKDRKS